MLSGVTGEPLDARIFMGPVYYHGLKHFSGRQDPQPGARAEPGGDAAAHGGAVEERRDSRGEMEKDGLLSHGAMFALRDRLSDNSDATMVVFCRTCGRIGEHRHSTRYGQGRVTKPFCRVPAQAVPRLQLRDPSSPLRDGAAASGTGGDAHHPEDHAEGFAGGRGDVGAATGEDDVGATADEW